MKIFFQVFKNTPYFGRIYSFEVLIAITSELSSLFIYTMLIKLLCSNSQYGLAQKTSERKEEKKDSHVDWWLFKDATPWIDFNEVKNE